MNPMEMKIRDLDVRASKRPILRRLNLDFDSGRCHVVLGPSGSGKTTLLRCLNRLTDLFPELVVRGRVVIPWDGGERDVLAPGVPAEQVRRRVGMVFQNPHVLPVNILENFRIPLASVLDCGRAEVQERAESALRGTGLWPEVRDRLDTPAMHLSGGQQQRLCLARALALEPSVLLLDEPTANLDFRAAAAIEDLVAQLKDRCLVILVSHSLDQAVRLADRAVVLADGAVVLDTDSAGLYVADDLKPAVTRIFNGGTGD